MKIVLSRKGLDSSAQGGRGISPIVNGRPISIPIPTRHRPSGTTYDDLGLGEIVVHATNGRLNGACYCHHDPMFEAGRCAFGQTGAAQSHLSNNGVGAGDVFLFFGLFGNVDRSDRHHRIFGYLEVEEVLAPGSSPGCEPLLHGFSRRHPHTIGDWHPNNTIYVGKGTTAVAAGLGLRLSAADGPASRWNVPPWLRGAGLTYHAKPGRWGCDNTLQAAARGQEFVSDISGVAEAIPWLDRILMEISEDERPTRITN